MHVVGTWSNIMASIKSARVQRPQAATPLQGFRLKVCLDRKPEACSTCTAWTMPEAWNNVQSNITDYVAAALPLSVEE